jgi:hypothetical protein
MGLPVFRTSRERPDRNTLNVLVLLLNSASDSALKLRGGAPARPCLTSLFLEDHD